MSRCNRTRRAALDARRHPAPDFGSTLELARKLTRPPTLSRKTNAAINVFFSSRLLAIGLLFTFFLGAHQAQLVSFWIRVDFAAFGFARKPDLAEPRRPSNATVGVLCVPKRGGLCSTAADAPAP